MKEKMTKDQKRQQLRERNTPPHLSVLEEVGNAITHGIGALVALIGMILLLLKSNSSEKIIAALIFGGSMFLLMLMSCLYHAFKSDTKVKRLWRRFDYTSIYFLINGTFAPICLVFADSRWALVLFAVQWLLAITGIVMIMIYGPGKWPALHYTLYFLIGWSGICFLPDLYQHNQPLLYMILLGGVVYTAGMIPFSKHYKGSHFLWHLFVLAGALLHWIGIYFFLY
ncbi:hypothetical protein DWW36_18460 [Erysipelotrichaceae bacterium AF15-26LB]|nr:hypothetical protein HMPREF0983_00732 [Erysipelotrichaceae bacterium 3_1_53]MCR0350261.1 hemolysin III family protein [[Clostridium] innocuum]RJV83125.1 hypothetical protein DWX45_20755 [Erysipelotrichaceae bacterium AF19-24AC]RJV83297.1 hypothetical protein DWW36_18460 [Erysipelotrichaceae bacterium AF15-26LB]